MYVIGLDIGTTCTKAVLVDEQGKVAATGSSGYPLLSNGCRVEQRAQDWTKAAVIAIRQAISERDGSQVAGISLSTQGGSTVAVDENGQFLGNSVTWMDSRAQEEAAEISKELGDEYIYRTTGWKINPALDAAKLRNLKKDPDYKSAKKYWTTLEVLNHYLTGEAVIDPTNAAMRQLYNIEKDEWDETMLTAAHTTEEELPQVKPTGEQIGVLCQRAAEETGLLAGIPVFNGAHDQYCASIGAGAIRDGDMLLSAGTTWVLMGIGTKPLFTNSFIAPGRHPVRGLYGAIASLVCSGASLQWFKNEFLPEDFALMNEKAAERREKTRDLFFYPYLTGACYPIWNLKAKGTFTGMNLEHDRFDFARAIMEGVAFGVKRGIADFEDNGCEIHQITMMGGASKSPLWCQMIASITNIPINRLNQADICGVGAAMIAACGLGIYDSYEQAAEQMVHTEHIYEPVPEERVFYQEKFEAYDKLWKFMQMYYESE